jgi:ribosome-associated protein
MIDTKETTSAERAELIINALLDKKAENVLSLNLTNIPNSISKYFIICHGTSSTQINALSDSVIKVLREKATEKPWHIEGAENAEWILIDYVDVVVHIFNKESRNFYQLESLWADAEIKKFD